MTYSRTLVVLAKSIKKRNFCIAGKNTETYDWVRPVKGTPFTGEELCNLSNRSDQIKVFDVVEMTFIKEVPEVFQPENELVDMNTKWRYLGDFQIRDLDTIIDRNQYDLLDQVKDRIIHKANICSLNLQTSLQLIKISNSNDAKIIYQLEFNKKYFKPKLHFNHKGISYTLPITDPTIPISYQRKKSKSLENAYVAIGIGEEYLNAHYIFVIMLREI